jgi:hypothetical protein
MSSVRKETAAAPPQVAAELARNETLMRLLPDMLEAIKLPQEGAQVSGRGGGAGRRLAAWGVGELTRSPPSAARRGRVHRSQWLLRPLQDGVSLARRVASRRVAHRSEPRRAFPASV